MRAWDSVAKVGADIGFIPNQHSKKWRFCLWGISAVYSKPLSFREKRALYGRGSKALHSWTRGQINVSPSSSTDNRRLLISCGKNSNGEEFKTFGILLNPDTLIYERDEDFSLEQWEAGLNGGVHKPNPQNVARIVAVGPISKKDLVAKVMEKFGCQKSVAYEAIGKANGDTIELNVEKKFELKKSAA